MKLQRTAVLGVAVVALVLALPEAASAQDFLTVKKVVCTPERMTRCKAPGAECETRDASSGDKARLLVIDFAAKKAFMRHEGKERPYGDVAEDKVEGGVRSIVIARGESERKSMTPFRLMKDGKMEGTRNEGRIKMEITCKRDE